MEFFLISAHINIILKLFYVFSIKTCCSVSVAGNVMTFPVKKGENLWLKVCFFQQTFLVCLAISQAINLISMSETGPNLIEKISF